MCEIPSRRFNTVFIGLLLGRGSLPPDFANRCLKSLALVLADHFRQIVPADV